VSHFQAAEDLIRQIEDRFERKSGVMAVQKNFEGISKEIYDRSVVIGVGVEPTEMRTARAIGQQAVEFGFGKSMRTGRGKGFEFRGKTTLTATLLRNGDFIKTTDTVLGFRRESLPMDRSNQRPGILKSRNLFETGRPMACQP
jgi:hypothetical protein